MSNSNLTELKTRLQEVDDLHRAGYVLYWDQQTCMPPGGAAARGRQLATLSRLAHEKFTDKAMGRLLDELEPLSRELPFESFEASLLRVTRRDYERAIKAPSAFVSEMTDHGANTFSVWVQARPENDFAKVRPYLEKTLELSRQMADFYPGYDHIADPLIDQDDDGMKAETVRRVFNELREQLVPLVQAVTAQPSADDSVLTQRYPEAAQLAFGRKVVERYGYDFKRGREDKAAHPFQITFSVGDARITTRVNENDLGDALFSTMHESGHGMYEQGIDPALEGTPLARGTSSGVHESQSRLWENLVGRSRGFWEHTYPELQQVFPEQLGEAPLETFYRAINKVSRSLIRTGADELTYNLHVMIRFELELQMLEGKLAVRDLPEAWRARYQEDLGIAPEDDQDGVLQDVHWYAGRIGGVFQGYTLGNIMSAQFYEAALKTHPDIPARISQGDFAALHSWLKENIYRHGRKFTADELLQRVTGKGLTVEPYIRYLKEKYSELYAL
jgi:carboxypeptidase Taq